MNVRQVSQALLKARLFVKAEKCLFHSKTVFLGFIVFEEMVGMDPGKVSAVMNWPIPQSVKEVQRFLGFNFYRRFIRNFSLVAAPIIALMRKNSSSCVCLDSGSR